MKYFVEKVILLWEGENQHKNMRFDCDLYTDDLNLFRSGLKIDYGADHVLFNYQEIPKAENGKRIKKLYEHEID